jgi:hypothetical protein
VRMKRIAVVASWALLLSLTPILGTGHLALATPEDDLVVGAGQFFPPQPPAVGMIQLSFSARGELNHADQTFNPAEGRARIVIDDISRNGTVDCLKGTFGSGFLEGTFDEPVVFGGVTYPDFFIGFHDNDWLTGESNDVLEDVAQVHFDPDATPCTGFTATGWGNFLDQGNILVINRPPV